MKVVVTGPESTGKTILSNKLAGHFQAKLVPEYARIYLENNQGIYERQDLLSIAKEQIALEDQANNESPDILICDTSLEVLRVWSEWKFGICDEFILSQSHARKPDLFLLLTPDLPWEPDPLRENQNNREKLFVKYQNALAEYEVPVIEISGKNELRIQNAISAIEIFKSSNPGR